MNAPEILTVKELDNQAVEALYEVGALLALQSWAARSPVCSASVLMIRLIRLKVLVRRALLTPFNCIWSCRSIMRKGPPLQRP